MVTHASKKRVWGGVGVGMTSCQLSYGEDLERRRGEISW